MSRNKSKTLIGNRYGASVAGGSVGHTNKIKAVSGNSDDTDLLCEGCSVVNPLKQNEFAPNDTTCFDISSLKPEAVEGRAPDMERCSFMLSNERGFSSMVSSAKSMTALSQLVDKTDSDTGGMLLNDVEEALVSNDGGGDMGDMSQARAIRGRGSYSEMEEMSVEQMKRACSENPQSAYCFGKKSSEDSSSYVGGL